ncbi:MAG: 50S ribosomal protein L32 [Elusimicrobia bacterium RIFOXYA2_FULL_39_19]|nr:MAG: 50S ribosomal protein L32 [Elusimicrobia bacterium RIFOXYA2_FULL_39_19]
MPCPKRRHTRMRGRMRCAANWKLTATNSSECTQCKANKLPHLVCPKCGFYNGEMIVIKKEKKKQEAAAQGTAK